jgi:hypothetical protein
MRGLLRRVLLVVSLASLGGCGAFRASAGLCLGLGGSVRAGPLDVGVLGGASYEWGNAYGAVGSQVTIDLGLAVARIEALGDGSTLRRNGKEEKAPFRGRAEGLFVDGVYPFLDSKSEARPYMVTRPSEIAVSLYALFFSFHLGFDPIGLARDAWGFIRAAAGGESPEPPDGSFRELPPPEDGWSEPPYTIASAEDLAGLESGTAVERALALRKVGQLLGDPLALFASGSETIEHDVPIRDGLEQLLLEDATVSALAREGDAESRDAFERARATDDPDAIGEALRRYPFASGRTRFLRVRAELLVERGDLEDAVEALEELAARASELDDEDTKAARALLPRVRALAARSPVAHPLGEAWSGSVDAGGYWLGASGRAVWAMTPGGEIAWERSDALPLDFFARKVVGRISELVVVEAMARERPWVMALDDDGAVRWRVPLPGPARGCGPMDQVYALGSGRVYVARTDRALAIEARSGRLLWMRVRHDPEPEAKKLWKEIVPMDWRAPEGPERRRPDGRSGFRVRVTPEVFELTSGAGRRVERLDARTGALLPE